MNNGWDNSEFRWKPGRRRETVYIDLLAPIKWVAKWAVYIGIAYLIYTNI